MNDEVLKYIIMLTIVTHIFPSVNLQFVSFSTYAIFDIDALLHLFVKNDECDRIM